MIVRAVKAFYSWHMAFPMGASRIAVVVPDTMLGVLAVPMVCMSWPILLLLKLPPMTVIAAAGVFALMSPLLVWQAVIVSGRGVTVFRTLLVFPYWVTKVPPGTEVELYEAYEDPAPSGVAYDLRKDYLHIGNSWNARLLFGLLRGFEEQVRPDASLEPTSEK